MKKYECTGIKRANNDINISWTNSHKLIGSTPFVIGGKTGVTPTAGPCLATCLEKDNVKLFVVVIKCSNMALRFDETMNLFNWAMENRVCLGKIPMSLRRINQ